MSAAYLDGHGDRCPKCGQGVLLTREISKGEHKGKRYLSCSHYPDCDHREWPKKAVAPLDGHGKPCPKCGEGVMETKEFTKDGKTVRFLSCSRYRDGCKHAERPVPPLPGHGGACPKCGQGTLLTREFTKDGETSRFLACSRRADGCKHTEQGVPPLPGHGDACPKCGKGILLTREFTKDGKTSRFLSCDQGSAANGKMCRFAYWPPQG